MNTASQCKRLRGSVAAIMIAAITCAAGSGARAAEPATQPAGADSDPVTTKPFTPKNLSELAIELTESQKAAMSAVVDGETWNETAFFKMLDRVAELTDPEAAARGFHSLEAPAVDNLIKLPNRYRAQKIRLTMRVYKSKEHTSGSPEWDATRNWPKGRKVWYLAGYHISEDIPTEDQKVRASELVVFSLVDPTELLGRPTGTNDSGEQYYATPGRNIKVAGVFYKVFQEVTKDSADSNPRTRDYALVLGYYLAQAPRPAASGRSNVIRNMVIVIGVVLMGLLFMVRTKTKRVRATPIGSGAAGVKYTPLRNTEDDDLPPDQRPDEPVDQDLVNALQAFEKKRQNSDGTNDKS